MVEKLKSFKLEWLVAAVLLPIAAFLRYQKFSHAELIGDEIQQVGILYQRFFPFWEWEAPSEFSCFVGDYLLNYHFVNWFYGNVWAMRIPHIAFHALGFVFLFLVMRRMSFTIIGFIVTLSIYSLNTVLIDHSFEIRPYAVLPTFALMSYYFWDKYLMDDKEVSSIVKIFWSLFIILITGFHAYGLFIVFLPGMYHLFRAINTYSFLQVWKKHGAYLGITSLIGFSLWFYYALGTHVTYNPIITKMDLSTFDYIPNPLIDFVGFLKGVVGNLFGRRFFYIFLLGLVGLVLGSKDEIKSRILFVLILVVIAIQCIYVPSLIENYVFVQRQFIWVIPFFALFIGWLWNSIYISIKQKFARS